MAWFDRPAASILSTSSSRLVSGSTMPGTAAVVPRPGSGVACAGVKGALEPGQAGERDSAAAWPARWAAISRPSSAAIGGPSSVKTRT